uniref:SAM domain-containing protein n=1 Tax=Panagrellus redivivus TaxID=6233 RepID=A0A7E4WA31_PANRE
MRSEVPESVNGDGDSASIAPEPLPEGWIEEKVQVDRKKLELMISGTLDDAPLPPASEYFDSVEKETCTRISWPSRLKIGAKTKKDPFVKIAGEPTNVEKAKDNILILLRVKKDRITLKMEIGHTSHSHIIGRGGRNTQDVMRETNCHIHFPDSNKHNELDKNNQVSIAGGVFQVERARSKLRLISPINLNVTVDVGLNGLAIINIPEIQRSLVTNDISVQILSPTPSLLQLVIRASVYFEHDVLTIVNLFHHRLNSMGISTESSICRSNFDLRPSLLQPNYGLFSLNTIRWIAFQTKTQMQFSPQGSSILVMGAAASVFSARRYLTGLLPVSIQFEKPSDYGNTKQILRNLEQRYDVTIGDKKKTSGNNNDVLMVIRSYEANLENVYLARQKLLQSDLSEALSVKEYDFMRDILNKIADASYMKEATTPNNFRSNMFDTSLPPPPPTPLQPQWIQNAPEPYSTSQTTPNFLIGKSCFDAFTSERSSPVFPDLCNGNDPRETVIAQAMLDKNIGVKSDHWKTPGLERQMNMNREKMLLKANKATYVPDAVEVRHPTDMWSGYGFSTSLPPDILKLGIKQIWENPEESEHGFGATLSINKKTKTVSNRGPPPQPPAPAPQPPPSLPDPPLQSSAIFNKGLPSVREEEELSDYNQSISSNFSASLSQTAREFPLPPLFKRHAFAASASVFESTPALNNDINWNIDVFVDPAMVLAQLGCSEYLPQFRDQEIDMQAFLLLDEQNLKDIGVSTMGARKKIFNAILSRFRFWFFTTVEF